MPLQMTVRAFLDFCRSLYPALDKSLETRLLALFELPPDRKLKHLSRGMRMKASLLSSLAYHPKLIVMDEPFSGLDPVVRDELMQGVLELAGSGDWTLLISSHDIDDVERLVDHTAIIESGKLLIEESLDSLQQRFRTVHATLPQPTTPPLPLPASCIVLEIAGTQARWIETAFNPQSEQTYKSSIPAATFALQTMSLKEIYKALVKNTNTSKGAR